MSQKECGVPQAVVGSLTQGCLARVCDGTKSRLSHLRVSGRQIQRAQPQLQPLVLKGGQRPMPYPFRHVSRFSETIEPLQQFRMAEAGVEAERMVRKDLLQRFEV